MNRVAFLFSGQGSQYIGMCKKLHDNFDIVRKTFEEANDVLGFDLRKICFEGSSNELSKTENTQPAILTTSVAQFKVYMDEVGIEPSFLAGHSIGEYSALVCAESIRFNDALRLVRARGKFMQEQGQHKVGTMAAIRNVDEKVIEDEVYKLSSKGSVICISNYNGEKNIVVSGELQAVKLISEISKKKGGEVINLNVSSAFHSPMMKEAASKLKNELIKYSFANPKYKVLSNVTGLPYKDKQEIMGALSDQIVKPVKWKSIMNFLQENQIDVSIEFGPKATLRNLVRNNIINGKAFSYDKEDDIREIKERFLHGKTESNTKEYSLISRCLGIAVSTKNYNWNNDEYQKGVIEPYQKIEEIKRELDKSGKEPTVEQMSVAINMLKTIFKTKKTPMHEQDERLNELLNETDTKKYFTSIKI